ncbi:MAG: hypothetical protein QOK26_1665 [Pseudonocardiales bacterium]|nr:hypothetical protein [Pseudonocardiales bacterium]MDT7599588.1 hypothetical protein [Pseudonocardiales bacterium]
MIQTTVPLVPITYFTSVLATAAVAALDTTPHGWLSALVALAGVAVVKAVTR